jgi:hypothetical protein
MTGPETDLERIETALAEGRATATDPRERELQELALALQADSPEPSLAFKTDLDRRTHEGFKTQRRGLTLPRFWLPALATATALVAVAVVALGVLGGDNQRNPTTAVVEPATDLGASTPAPGAARLTNESRRVERSVRLTIAAARDKLQEAADGVGTVAESHRGFVLQSQVNTGDAGPPGGSFTLRVPQKELQATIADLSKLGHLRARSETGQDMTGVYNDVQNKLGNALIERRVLKIKLHHAKGHRRDSIRARLAELSAAVHGLNSQMNDLRRRTVYSTIYVTIEQARGAAGAGGTGAAWHDAMHTLEGMLNFTVRALGVLLPLALLAGLAALAGRSLRRRRREAPLL